MVRLTVFGSNGTYPTADRPASGYLVASGDSSVLLDMGPGVFAALHGTGRLPDAVVLSHGHPDHCLDVLSLFSYLRFDAIDRWGLPVYAPAGVIERLAGFSGAGSDHDFFKALQPRVIEPGMVVEVGELRLRFGAAVHPVPAVCTRVEGRGKAFVYSGDTGPGGDLLDLSTGADLLLCEATHQGTPPPDRYPYHLYAAEAGAVAHDAGVRILVVTHVSPALDPEVSVHEAAAHFTGPIRAAEPGLEVGL